MRLIRGNARGNGAGNGKRSLWLAAFAAVALALQAQSPPPAGGLSSQPPSAGSNQSDLLTSASVSPDIAAAIQNNPRTCSGFVPAGTAIPDNAADTLLSYHVATDGEPSDATVLRSSGSRELDDAAIACAKATRWQPQLIDGKPAEIGATGLVSWTSRAHPFVPIAPFGTWSPCRRTTRPDFTIPKGERLLFLITSRAMAAFGK